MAIASTALRTTTTREAIQEGADGSQEVVEEEGAGRTEEDTEEVRTL